jgi:hypothetical protein
MSAPHDWRDCPYGDLITEMRTDIKAMRVDQTALLTKVTALEATQTANRAWVEWLRWLGGPILAALVAWITVAISRGATHATK